MTKIKLYLVVILIVVQELYGSNPDLIVTTPLGPIEGHIGLSVNQMPFYKFEGVPYAKPPVGELRYEDPQDPEPWKGIWKANSIFRCLQYDHFTVDSEKNYLVHGEEDCLYVNVYTTNLDQNANLDVLVHIHGGAFMFGKGASYGPEIIIERGIVFVTFNYRLGPLGFLSTEDDVMPGNLGLKDQIKALKWVKENIKYFGGNPNSITLHGLSAGGASVHFHYLLPSSKGLFNQGISQSGVVLNSWVMVENAREKTQKIADLVGCPSQNSKEILECLKSKPARQIVQAVNEFQPFLYNPFSPFGVVVDGKWAKNPVLPDHPYNLLKQGKVQDLPWIVSYTSAEGLYPAADFYSDDQHLREIDQKWNEIMPFVLHYNDSVNPALRDSVSQQIRKHYLGDKPVNKETYSTLIELMGDRLFLVDIEKAAKLHSSVVKSEVYGYLFNFRGSVSVSEHNSLSKDDIGVSHGDDTIYQIVMDKINTLQTKTDIQMSELLVNMVTTFMRDGKPDTSPEWIPLSKNRKDPIRLLKINNPDDLKLNYEDSVGQRLFWDSLPFEENEDLLNIKDEL